MEKVDPIRDKEKIREMKAALKKQQYRDFMIFLLGINTGLHIGDILNLKVNDVKDQTHIEIQEEKTGKPKRIRINGALKETIDEYVLGMEETDFLFHSQKRDENGKKKPISKVHAWRILNQAAKTVGLQKIGTHSLRKSFGYHHYKQHKDVALLQKIFNHSSPSITLAYIGISQEEMDSSIETLDI